MFVPVQENEEVMSISEKDADQAKQLEDLIASLPTRAPIFLPTPKVQITDQLAGLKRVKQIYDVDLDTLYRPALHALRAKYKGTKRAFIVGNGPSLNQTDLALLKNEVTFCVNGFFLKAPELDWKPTFYMVEDHLVAEDRSAEINALSGSVKLFPAYLAYCIDAADDVIFFNHRPRFSYPDGFDFSRDAAEITYTGCTVTFTMMQLAHWLGFEELILVGVDASYNIPEDAREDTDYGVGVLDMASDDTNHFHPNYFGKGYRWHDPQVGKMIEAYEEAYRETNNSGRAILNATVGGALEVFQRVSYGSLFSSDTSQPHHPRLAIIDMTAPGDGTATGNLKQSLIKSWPVGRVLAFSSNGNEGIASSFRSPEAQAFEGTYRSIKGAQKALLEFEPEVILYRPLNEKPELHELAKFAQKQGYPTAIWLMDDWPNRLRSTDLEQESYWNNELHAMFAASKLNLSISEAMSEAFEKRYGVEFVSVANGISENEWPAKSMSKEEGRVLVRYCGGLASDMSLASILDLATAIETLSAEFEIRLEINTRKHWLDKHGSKFDKKYQSTSISSTELTDQEYRRWLSEADIVVIAYNFDDLSADYIRYSRANKLPECLASGAALLGIGPTDIATLDELEKSEVGAIVSSPGAEAIAAKLRVWVESPELRVQAGRMGRLHALSHMSLKEQSNIFLTGIRGIAKTTAHSKGDPLPSDFFRKYVRCPSGKGNAVILEQIRRLKVVVARNIVFYAGWRGLVALTAIGFTAAPAVSSGFTLQSWGPTIGLVLAIALMGHVCATIFERLK